MKVLDKHLPRFGPKALSSSRRTMGEGVEHIAGGVARQAVEVEVEGVEAGAQMAAFVVIPRVGRASLN